MADAENSRRRFEKEKQDILDNTIDLFNTENEKVITDFVDNVINNNSELKNGKWIDEEYKRRGELLAEIIKNDEELGLYNEPFDNPMIKEDLDDEVSDWDVTLMDGLEDEEPFFTAEETENIFQEEPTEEEIQGNFSTIEPETENIFQEEPTTLESQDELKKKLLEIPQEDLVTTILVEASTSESQDFKENLYWESDDINPNQIIYDLENNKVIIPTSEEEIITEPTATPTPIINNILSRNVNPRRRNFR